MAQAMGNGAVYSHQTLTDIGEAVLYIMEYFHKEGLLGDVDAAITELIKRQKGVE